MDQNKKLEELYNYRKQCCTPISVNQYIVMLSDSNSNIMQYTGFDEKRELERIVGEKIHQYKFEEIKKYILNDVIHAQTFLYKLIENLNGNSIERIQLL